MVFFSTSYPLCTNKSVFLIYSMVKYFSIYAHIRKMNALSERMLTVGGSGSNWHLLRVYPPGNHKSCNIIELNKA